MARVRTWVRRGRFARRDLAAQAFGAEYLEHKRRSGRAAATAMGRDLRRYASSAWRFEQGQPPMGDGNRRLTHEILRLKGGKSLSAAQIPVI